MIVRLTVVRDDDTITGGSVPDVSNRADFKAAVAWLAHTAEQHLFNDE